MGYKGCKNCPNAPKTYEEFCIVKNRAKHGEHDKLIEWGLCPDAFSDTSPLCGAYDNVEEYKNLEYKSKMTTEQAIEILTMLDVCGLAYESKEIAIEALKKQTPQKVVNLGDGEAECPICRNDYEIGIYDWGRDYCNNCGQKLDWNIEQGTE